MAQAGEGREIDHPGEQQIIEIGIDPGQAGVVEVRADQGEIDVGGLALAAQGAGAVEHGALHLRVAGQHSLDRRDRRGGQSRGTQGGGWRGDRHRVSACRTRKLWCRARKAGVNASITSATIACACSRL